MAQPESATSDTRFFWVAPEKLCHEVHIEQSDPLDSNELGFRRRPRIRTLCPTSGTTPGLDEIELQFEHH